MTKKQKDLIAKAVPYVPHTPLTAIYIIPSGRPYKGLFQPTDFEHMILIGEDARNEIYYHINPSSETDVMAFFHLSHVHSIDIPHRHGAIRVCFSHVVEIQDTSMSSIIPVEYTEVTDEEWDENGEYHRPPEPGEEPNIWGDTGVDPQLDIPDHNS